MEEAKLSGIYVELDTLFDTRLACLAKYNDDTLAKALVNYTTRNIDSFPGIEYSTFKNDYDNRSKDILQDVVITNVIFFINDFIKKTIKLNYATPHKLKPKIIVNTYPYILTQEETSVIVESVFLVGDQLADVEVINMSYEQLTPAYINSQISIMVVYEYYRWLEAQSLNGNLRKSSCPEVTMISPKIYFKQQTDRVEGDPFDAMEQLARPFINLKLMAVGLFSSAQLTAL